MLLHKRSAKYIVGEKLISKDSSGLLIERMQFTMNGKVDERSLAAITKVSSTTSMAVKKAFGCVR